jgi:hypothetical protein
LLREANDVCASRSVGSRSAIVRERFADSFASAAAKPLKFVIRLPRSSPRLASFVKTVLV